MSLTNSHRILKILVANEATSITQVLKELAKLKNKEYPRNSFSVRLKNGTVNYDEMADIAEILGYEIQFVKKNSPDKVIK